MRDAVQGQSAGWSWVGVIFCEVVFLRQSGHTRDCLVSLGQADRSRPIMPHRDPSRVSLCPPGPRTPRSCGTRPTWASPTSATTTTASSGARWTWAFRRCPPPPRPPPRRRVRGRHEGVVKERDAVLGHSYSELTATLSSPLCCRLQVPASAPRPCSTPPFPWRRARRRR